MAYQNAARTVRAWTVQRELSSLRVFWAALLTGWVALAAAGMAYAGLKGIPASAAAPLLAAFLIEYPFYLLPGVEAARAHLEAALPDLRLSLFLVASMLAPYLVYAVGSGSFQWLALAKLAALGFALALWYRVLPPSAPSDVAFLLVVAGVMLRGYFAGIYQPVAGVRMEILGHVSLFHVCALVMMVDRRIGETGFGFWPRRADWFAGVRQFLFFLPIGLPLGLGLDVLGLGSLNITPWKVAGTFFGFLWVVGLLEEFFFRGLLQQWLERWTGSPRGGLLLAALLFGAVHLPFRGFPNWRFALVAAVAGWFYGRAFQETGSIRASTVTHALVVTMWRTFFV